MQHTRSNKDDKGTHFLVFLDKCINCGGLERALVLEKMKFW